MKPEAEPLDGRVLVFEAGWRITEDDSNIYAGEFAMLLIDDQTTPIAWIASGDIVELEEIGRPVR